MTAGREGTVVARSRISARRTARRMSSGLIVMDASMAAWMVFPDGSWPAPVNQFSPFGVDVPSSSALVYELSLPEHFQCSGFQVSVFDGLAGVFLQLTDKSVKQVVDCHGVFRRVPFAVRTRPMPFGLLRHHGRHEASDSVHRGLRALLLGQTHPCASDSCSKVHAGEFCSYLPWGCISALVASVPFSLFLLFGSADHYAEYRDRQYGCTPYD